VAHHRFARHNAATRRPVKCAIDTLIIAYVVVFLAALCGVALYYEQRQKRFGRRPAKTTFSAAKNAVSLYTDDADVGSFPLPAMRHAERSHQILTA